MAGTRRIVGVVAICAIVALGPVLEADVPAYRGRPLVEVLRSIRERGLNLIYSDAVVPASAIVVTEPRATSPRAVLDEILKPLGLAARNGPGGSVLIVQAPMMPSTSRPESANRRPRPRFLEEVVVTPSHRRVVRDVPAAVRSLEGGDAVLVPTIGGDVSRVVEMLPGIVAPDNSAAFSVRGSEVRDVALVLDGLELYEPFHLRDFQSPFSFIDNGVVDGIEVYGGGFTAERGDRHGGFVEMTTAAPDEEHRVRLEAGTLNSRATLSTPMADGSLLVSARAWYPEALRDSIELGDTGLDPRFTDLYLKYTRHVSPRTIVAAHALLAEDRLDFVEPDGAEVVEADDRSGHAWLRAVRVWSSTVVSDTVVSLGRFERHRRGISDPEDVPLRVDDERSVDFFGLSHDMTWEVSPTQLVRAGFEVRPLRADYRYALVEQDSDRRVGIDPSGTSIATYMAYRAAPGTRLAVELGLRWDRQEHTGGDQLSPRVNAIWRPDSRSSLRLGLGRYSQSQRIHELRIEDGEVAFLPAELSRQVDVTAQRRFGRALDVRVDAYVRRLSRVQPRYENLFNPLELFPETEEDRTLIAPERARANGVEILLHGDPAAPLAWSASYSWSEIEDVIDGASVPRRWDQTHAATLLLARRWGDGWSASLAGTVHTGWPTTPVSGEIVTQPDGSTTAEPVLGPRNSARFSTYARLDGEIARVIRLRRGSLRLEIEIVNLTDRDNECCVDDVLLTPLTDGSVRAERELAYWLGVTPSFTVAWEF